LNTNQIRQLIKLCAAIRLREAGKSLGRTENIQYVCPFCIVTPLGLIKQGKENQYDKEKYRDMLLATAETVLGYFGFDKLLLEIPLKRETGSAGTRLMRRGIETSRMRKRKTHHAVLITTMIGVIR
jgi:hypothetical protein